MSRLTQVHAVVYILLCSTCYDLLCYFSLSLDSPVVPSIACEVANSRSRGGERPSSVAANHSLKLFIFLERAGSKRVGNDNEQWRQTMEVIHELRSSFNTLVVTHSRKFHQALHSVLNKLICNYGTHAKVRSGNAVEYYRYSEWVTWCYCPYRPAQCWILPFLE